MKKKLVKMYSLDKALARIKERSGSHADIFIRDTAQLLEWYGIEWVDAIEHKKPVMSILDDDEQPENDRKMEARAVIDAVVREVMEFSDDFIIWLALNLKKQFASYLKTRDEEEEAL